VWDYLNAVLFTAVPNTLPYNIKQAVRDHLFALIQRVPSLSTKEAEFTHNDGRTVRLLTAEGTIPIRFQNNTYNIPVSLWLDENYPHTPPICYVKPTPDMEVKHGHPFVDGSGVVHIAYLRDWRYTTSNLVDLADQLSRHFSQDPPLYAKPRPAPAEMGRPQHHQPHPGHHHPPYPARNPSPSYPHRPPSQPSPGVRPPSASFQPPPCRIIQLPPGYQQPPQRVAQPPTDARANAVRPEDAPSTTGGGANGRAQTPDNAFREQAFAVLVQRLTEKVCMIESHQMDKLQNLSTKLQERCQQAEEYHKHLTREREEIGWRVETLIAANVALDEWLGENEGSFDGELDIDTVFIGEDALTQQAISVSAEDAAIDDTLDGLDRALEAGVIPTDAYLKQVRALCRQQFMHRALAQQIATRRMQTAVPDSRPGGGHGFHQPENQRDVQSSMPLPSQQPWVQLNMPSTDGQTNYPTLTRF